MAVDVAISDAELARTHGLRTAEEIAEFKQKIARADAFLAGAPAEGETPKWESPTLRKQREKQEARAEAEARRREERRAADRQRIEEQEEARMARISAASELETGR